MSELNQLSFRVLSVQDSQTLMSLESSRASENGSDPIEIELASWTAPWRAESLEHYLPLGWSFGAYHDGVLVGYTLGQPMLFFKGQTQCLWVEHIFSASAEVRSELINVCVRWGRDKHFQQVLFNGRQQVPEAFQANVLPTLEMTCVRTTRANSTGY